MYCNGHMANVSEGETVWWMRSVQSNRITVTHKISHEIKIMEPPNYKSVVSMTPETERLRKGESLKHKNMRPRSRTGSGGILRVDVNKPNLISTELGQVDPPSPQPSIDRLSVTFATEERSICSSDASVKINVYVPPGTPPISSMEKVRFPTITDGEDSDEDYSASVTAIMQRRASTRKSRRKHRRTSSPFSHDQEGLQVRRRSSCFTTSSGDTAISMEESLPQEVTQEQIFENIRLHKEVLSSVKMQPWAMRRKLKLVQQAKSYIKRHQGALQERLAQSKYTRDILARWNIYLVQKLQHVRRELANLSNVLIPWESRIKEIESHFGSVVASYFTFLRWLFWVNLIISVVLVAFVAIPELLTSDAKTAGERKDIPDEEKERSTNLFILWDFEGVLQYSPMFYGYYNNRDGTEKGYRIPFAYFMTGLAVYIYSFVATLRKMAENSRMSKLSEKDDECVFSWKLFTGWDYMIGNAETGQNRVSSIILGFKEALLEEAEKKREPRNWKIIASRIMVNLAVLTLLAVSAYAVVVVVERSTELASSKSYWRRNETTIVMSLITFLFPMIFEILGFFEHYHPRKQLRLQLARIMVLNILNLYSLIFSLFGKISVMTSKLKVMKRTFELATNVTTPFSIESQTCHEILVNCPQVNALTAASLVLSNLTLAYLLTNINQTQNISNIFNSSNNSLNFKNNFSTASTNYDINFTLPSSLQNELNNNQIKNTKNSDIKNLETTTEKLNETTDYYEDDDEYFDFDYTKLYNSEKKLGSTENYSKNSDTTTEIYDSPNETSKYYEEDNEYTNFDYSTIKQPENEITTTDSSTSENTQTYASSTETTTDYEYENETAEYYEEDTEYFNFDYSTLNLNTSTTKNIIVQTVITTLLSTSTDENFSESITVTWNTEELVTTVYSTLKMLNSTFENGSLDFTTETDLGNFTTETTPNYTDFTEVTDTEIKAIITDLYQELTTESSTQCKITKCEDPNSGSISTIETTKRPSFDYKQRQELRKLCWETMFGQELVKLTVMDLSFTIISILAVDFIRAIFVRVMNKCWCWDLEKKFPQYGDFKIAENILHLVNNQGMVWMGMFFSPGITVINLIKLAIMMYLRSWAVLTCNVPHEVVFKASKSNNFYLALLLTMLFLCVLPVGYAIVWIRPSWHCGPFSNFKKIYYIFTESIENALPKALHPFLYYIASPSIVIPLLVLLILIIYYLISLSNALREANSDLKLQLRRERTEERRKMFQIADRRRRSGSGDSGDLDNTAFGKWKKLLPTLPNSKSFDADTSGKDNEGDNKNDNNKNKDFLVKFIKKAIKKPPESISPGADDATDTEQHDSLPDDINIQESKSEIDKKAMNTFRKLLHAKKQQRDAEAAKKTEEITSAKSSIENNKTHTKTKKPEKIRDKYRSTSRSSSSKDLRQDSITSNWSDNIPVIKISGTGSSECILEHQNESSTPSIAQINTKNKKPHKLTQQEHFDVDLKSDEIPELQVAEPQCPAAPLQVSSSSETLVTVRMEEYESPINKENKTLLSFDKNKDEKIKSKELSVDTDHSVDLQKSSTSDSTQASSRTKTESSSDYQE